MKVCSAGCDPAPKALSEFYAKPRGKLGVNARCKSCVLKAQKARRAADPDLARELDRLRARTKAYRKYQTEYKAARREKHLEYYRQYRQRKKQK